MYDESDFDEGPEDIERDMDWQDKAVLYGCLAAGVVCFVILVWGR